MHVLPRDQGRDPRVAAPRRVWGAETASGQCLWSKCTRKRNSQRDPSDTSDLSPGKKRLLGQRERLRAGALVLMDDSPRGENQPDTFPHPWVIYDCFFISWSVQRSHSRPLEFPDNSPKSLSATNPGPDKRAPRFLSLSRQI